MKQAKKSGQIALIILLLMVVILTISLSLASRSITDIKISQDEKEAVRAFSAAEAGVEQVLTNVPAYVGTGTVPVGSLTANVTVEEVINDIERSLDKNEAMTILLDGSSATSLTINWHKTGTDSDEADLEIIAYKNDYSFQRWAYGHSDESSGYIGFVDPGPGSAPFENKVVISVESNDKLIRIKALTAGTTIKIDSDADLSSTQQYKITSAVQAEGNKTGKIEVVRTVPILPSVFDYSLFSGGSL